MISIERYKTIADLINNAQDRGSDVVTHFSNMITTLSDSEILAASIDRQRLEDQIDATLDIMSVRHQSFARCMTDFVFILQKYVNDNYSSVNDFLSDNETKVLPVFADLSEVVGFLIDTLNIEGNIS